MDIYKPLETSGKTNYITLHKVSTTASIFAENVLAEAHVTRILTKSGRAPQDIV